MAQAKPKLIVIVGPTASGKSDLAVELAGYCGGEIVSADSIQVYRQLNIGSAKPSLEARKNIKHHLIDILDLDQEYNSAIFRKYALQAISDIKTAQKIPILCGGAMLYIKALIHGLADIDRIDIQTRQLVEDTWQKNGREYCLRWLEQLGAKTKFNDAQRIKRSLEVRLQTGRSIESFQIEHRFNQKDFNTLFIGINHPRHMLYERINQRASKMCQLGLVEECQQLLAKGYSPRLKPLKSIGYRQAIEFINGEYDEKKMLLGIQTSSRRYAKRQITWYNNNPDVNWVCGWSDEVAISVDKFLQS